MKKFTTLFAKAALIMAATTGSAYASWDCDPCAAPCDPCDGGASLYVSADFLWWRPNIDHLEWAAVKRVVATENETALGIKYLNAHPNWEPGVRGVVGLNNLLKGWNLTASYTYLGFAAIDEHSVEAPDVLNSTFLNGSLLRQPLPIGDFSSGTSKYNSDYNNWDILVSHKLNCNPCLDVMGFFGFSALYLDQYWRVSFENAVPDPVVPTQSGNTANITWESDFWGAGIKIGSSVAYNFTNELSAFGVASASLITGRDDNVVRSSTFNLDLRDPPGSLADSVTSIVKAEDDTDHWQYLPGFHLQGGIRYEVCLCDITVGLRAGYEFVKWYNLPNPRVAMATAFNASTISTSQNTTTYGFHGVFVGGDVQF